jgi:hypothetical protein
MASTTTQVEHGPTRTCSWEAARHASGHELGQTPDAVSLSRHNNITITNRHSPFPVVKGRFEEEAAIRSLIVDMKRARNRHISAAIRTQKRKNAKLLPPPPPPAAEEIATIDAEHGPFPVDIPEIFTIPDNRVSAPPPLPDHGSIVSIHPPPYMNGPLSRDDGRDEKAVIDVPNAEAAPSNVKSNKSSKHPKKEGDDIAPDLIKALVKKPEIITMSTFQKQFGKVDSWVKEFFGPSSLFFDDKSSTDLEAYMVLGDKQRLKVPFGGRRLRFGMKKLMKAKKESTMDDFAALPKHLHIAICNAMQAAKIADSRERVLICFDVLQLGEKLEDQHILVFLSATGAPLEPVHFKCAVGRKFDIPYFMATCWDVSISRSHLDNI